MSESTEKPKESSSLSTTSKRPLETDTSEASNAPKKSRPPNDDNKKKPTIPLSRIKQQWLRKHTTFFTNANDVIKHGVLVSVSSRQETRALGQFRGFLNYILEELLPERELEPKQAHFGIDGRDDRDDEEGEGGKDGGEEANGTGNEEAGPSHESTKEATKETTKDNAKVLSEQAIGHKGKMIDPIDTSCQGLIFFNLRIKDLDILDFVARVFDHLHNLRKSEQDKWANKLSFCHRIFPIQSSCEARLDTILSSLQPLVATLSPSKTYAIDLDVRNNPSMSEIKSQIISECAGTVGDRCKVNLKNPEQSVLVSVVKSAALLSVVPNYEQMYRYNLHRALGNIQ